ncbi:hypothetical protein FBUS_08188 [Fasciolopsis buskii]|uniref:Uncharacterized protein n=1 Tax=Fasciolopsis buskii TaxID=27845 RepID=A0A8E0RWV2_9TREM|nr:hypothetical protein FBUS_08188 [Fasciolopsis buski]
MQARRIGIRTHRERLKMLLSPIPEQPELVDRAPPTGTDLSDNPDQDSEGAYISKKKIKQQERTLNRLAETVAALPNPKVFRRPSARQPSRRLRNNARKTTSPTSPSNGFVTRAQLSYEDGVPLIGPAVTNPDPYTHSTLRVASSVPDLSSTMRRLSRAAAQRADITQVQWAPLPPPSSSGQTDAVAPPTYDQTMFEDTFGANPPKTSAQAKRLAKRQRKGTVRPSDFAKSHPRAGRIGDRRVRRTKEEQLALKLARLAPDAFPDKNPEPHRSSLIEITLPNRPNSPPIPGAKRPSQSRLSTGNLPDLCLDEGDSISWSSPNHIRYRRARSVSELAVSPLAVKLFQSQPSLVHSLGKSLVSTVSDRSKTSRK